MGEPPDRRIEASWDANADAWANAVREQAIESRRLVTDQAIVDAVHACSGRRVLDVGCGEGWLARRLAAEGRDVVGFDGSSTLIARAQAAGGATFLVLDYEQFASDPARVGPGFDVAVCNFSLLTEHIAPVLAAIRAVGSPDAHLVVQTVHPAAATDGGRKDGWREERYETLPGRWQPMPWYFRTRSSWLRELATAGWRLHDIAEPIHPSTSSPASLILTAVMRRDGD